MYIWLCDYPVEGKLRYAERCCYSVCERFNLNLKFGKFIWTQTHSIRPLSALLPGNTSMETFVDDNEAQARIENQETWMNRWDEEAQMHGH